MPTYMVRCFNGAHQPESEDYYSLDAEDELAAAARSTAVRSPDVIWSKVSQEKGPRPGVRPFSAS
jgi:hypothetical protein